MNWIKKMLGVKPPTSIPQIKSKDGERATDYDITFIEKGICPNCEVGKLYEGPSGGLSTNYRCDHCGQGFNITIIGGELIREWVENIGNDEYWINDKK